VCAHCQGRPAGVQAESLFPVRAPLSLAHTALGRPALDPLRGRYDFNRSIFPAFMTPAAAPTTTDPTPGRPDRRQRRPRLRWSPSVAVDRLGTANGVSPVGSLPLQMS
jgi:hypothetical protein